MEPPRKELVVGDNPGDGESSESVVLQCGSSADVEHGEEVVRGETRARESGGFVSGRSISAALHSYCDGLESEIVVGGPKAQGLLRGLSVEVEDWSHMDKLGCLVENSCAEDVDVVSDRDDAVSVRVLSRSDGDRRMDSLQNGFAYLTSGISKGPCRTQKSFMHDPFGVGESRGMVDSLPMKRKLDDMEECCTVVESEMCEDSVSEDDWTSSSSVSDASDSESEQWTRRRNLIKRKRSGGDITEAFQPRSGLLFKSRSALDQEELVDCNEELKGMQELLQMQIQASDRREAGMKQRMEMMMDMLFKHMGHVEKRVSILEDVAQPQDQVLERINVKLEKVMEGFSTLNENLTILSACLSKNLESQ